MFFSDIIEQLGVGSWEINEKNHMIYEISKAPLKIQFFPETAKLICKEKEFDIALTNFSELSFKDEEIKSQDIETDEENDDYEDNEHIIVTNLYYKDTLLFGKTSNSMVPFKDLCEKLIELFDDDIDCSPKAQVINLANELSLKTDSTFNPDLYKLLLKYGTRMEEAYNNGCLHENSEILVFLEEFSGKITENLAKNALNVGLGMLFGGPKALAGAAINLAKAATPRIAKGAVNNKADSKGFMLLTDKNVILAKPDGIMDYDFNEATEIFSARQDEMLVGIVDIYDDCENMVLDNIAQTKWNVFKNQLRKIKKESEQIAIEESSMPKENDIDSFEEAEKKITKLKKMLDSGLISQEDFDAKKTEILSEI